MSRAREIRDAEHQVETERYQCITCSGVAQAHSDYCVHCEVYWNDVKNGLFDKGDEKWAESSSSTSTGR